MSFVLRGDPCIGYLGLPRSSSRSSCAILIYLGNIPAPSSPCSVPLGSQPFLREALKDRLALLGLGQTLPLTPAVFQRGHQDAAERQRAKPGTRARDAADTFLLQLFPCRLRARAPTAGSAGSLKYLPVLCCLNLRRVSWENTQRCRARRPAPACPFLPGVGLLGLRAEREQAGWKGRAVFPSPPPPQGNL